jgi:hypothetical protein
MSTLTIIIQDFLQQLNDRKNIWWELIARFRNSYLSYEFFRTSSRFSNQSFYFSEQYDKFSDIFNSANLYRQNSSYTHANQTQYEQQAQILSNARSLKASKSRLQITAGSSKEFDSST